MLHTKLSRTAAALKNWNKKKVRWATFISGIANEVIFRLDLAQEDRELTEAERNLRSLLKIKLLGIAAIDRARWRQKSRVTQIKEGDASTRFFHLRANGECRKNHIPVLNGANDPVSDHEGKAKILLDRFKQHMGTPFSRTNTLNWNSLGLPRLDLT